MKKSNNIIEFKESKKNINIYNKIFKSLYKNKATIDYSKIIVRKPWGYEYVIYQNNKIAITILYINKNHMTSLHAHPRKKTSLIVLEGKIKCENLDNFNIVKTGECVLIDKKVFHKSKNISNKTSILMEVETPNKKYDILRYKDNYGRSKKGYETSENYSLNTNNYNYVSLLGSKTYHNITKKFGRSSITFLEINSINNFKNTILKNLNSIFIVLEGKIKINDIIFSDGDPFQGINIDFSKDKIILSKKVLILNVKKDDGYIKASDIIVRVLQNQNIKNVFLVAGDSNLHLLDSIGRNEEFNYNVFSNEYHASLASVGYSKYKQKPAVLILSSGHSTLKTIEAIYSAYIDSEPLIVISGQAIRGQNTSKELRQLGNKSVDIIALVKNITKYSVVINNETDLVYHLEKSIYISQEGRPGPVWIDIPIDVMGKILDEDKIKHFSSSEYLNKLKYENINNDISRVYKYLNLSKKPVLLIGYGVRLSRYENQILKLIKKLKIPVLTSRRGSDLIESSDKLYFGRPGVYGNRYSNFILQKTDLLISIGSRLSIPLIGRNFRNFAKNAKKIIVDVDAKELNKKTVKADLKLNYSSDIFIDGMNRKKIKVKSFNKWIDTCNIIKKQINIKLEKYEHNTNINPYLFIKDLSKIIPASSLILMDGGAIMNYTMQCFEIKKNQRLITASGLDNEGFALAASLGLTSENYKNLSIVLCEESSFYLFSEYIYKFLDRKIPIKIFCFSGIKNLTLRNSQRDFFNSRYVATNDLVNKYNIISNKKMYKDLNFVNIKNSKNYKNKIKSALVSKKPTLIFIEVDQKHEIKPKMGFSINYAGKWTQNSLENMYPELDKKIVDKIMRL